MEGVALVIVTGLAPVVAAIGIYLIRTFPKVVTLEAKVDGMRETAEDIKDRLERLEDVKIIGRIRRE